MRTIRLLFGIILVLVCHCSATYAQSVRVSGKVSARSSGAPLASATVTVKGTSVHTLTDSTGSFFINVPKPGAVLEFSYVGAAPQSYTVTGPGLIDIVLDDRDNSIADVVVVGYGTQKKSVVTGAISSIKAGDLANMPVSRIEQSLQGRTSGLTIAAGSGQPGSSATVRIRGTTSINNSDPLYIVDGVQVDVGGIDFLNQNDIESVEVLKDAATAAIYGTRAAGGVILITTKKGKAGRMVVSYNGYYGTQEPAKKLHLLDATQYATLRNEAAVNAGNAAPFANPSSFGKGTDWQSLIFNNSAKIQDHELSISGGNERSTYYSSFGYFDQEGIVATDISRYKRFTARFNSTHKLQSWLNVGSNISYSYIKSRGLGNTNSEFGGPLSSAINLDPITPVVITDPNVIGSAPYSTQPVVKDANGHPYGISKYVAQEMTNPLAYIQTRKGNFGYSHNFVANAYAEVEFIKGLKFRSSIGAKMAFYGSESFTPIYYLSATQNNLTNTSYYREANQNLLWNWDNTLSYMHSIGKHNFTVMAGTSAQKTSGTRVNGTYQGLPVSSFDEASFNYSLPAASRIAGGGENQPYALSSYFGRVTYDYDQKYLFTGILRRDGSSRFGSNNKYGYFPSASVGWVPSRENFWPVMNAVSYLKIRGSYGVTGNDQSLSDFQYISTVSGGRNYTFGNDNVIVGNSPNAPANPNLKWEQTSQLDIGFDARLFQYFSLTFDYFRKKTTGMLLQVQLPGYAGVDGKPYGNIADLKDNGFEVELGYSQRVGEVNIDVKGNASYVKNTITSIGANSFLSAGSFQASSYEIARTMVGQSIGSFYGFKTEGLFQTAQDVNNYVGKSGQPIQPNAKPGDFRFADLNGDGKIDANDRMFLGNPTPRWTYGFTASAAWKGFDLLVFGQGVSGNKIFQGLRRLDIPAANYTTAALGRWTGPGSSNDYPRLVDGDPNGNFTKPSAFYLSNGAYLRLKVVQLGYTLPAAWVQRCGLQKVRVYISGNNLATITKYTGYDPEIGGSSYGIDRGIYPQARSFMAGLNVTL